MSAPEQVLNAAMALGSDDRGSVLDRLIDEIPPPSGTYDVRSELDRRLADIEANPDNEVSWDELKAECKIEMNFRGSPR